MVGRLIPAGTGFAYHSSRRRKDEGTEEGGPDEDKGGMTAQEVEMALSEALQAESSSRD